MSLKTYIDFNILSYGGTETTCYLLPLHKERRLSLYSSRSTNTEDKECTFLTLKTLSLRIIIFSAMKRMEARERLEGEKSVCSKSEAFQVIYKLIIEKLGGRLMSFNWFQKHPRDYQALLDPFTDYFLENLSEAKWWTETKKGILFFENIRKDDGINYKNKMYDIRSSCIKTVSDYYHEYQPNKSNQPTK